MSHDFKKFPELTNSQMDMYYFESPHKQITEDFRGVVTKVTDGDTIRIEANFRDFTFPVRFLDTNAPELDEVGGVESKKWLESEILGQEIEIRIDRNNRVEKWGRLLGQIFFRGTNMNEESIRTDHAKIFEKRNENKIQNLDQIIRGIK